MEQLSGLLAFKVAAVLGWLVLLLALERMFPLAKVVGGFRRVAKNLSLAGFNALLSPLIVVPVSAFAASHALGWRPPWWGGWTGLALDILVLDLWIYWWHRANHEWPLLWRFHEVHHLDEFLDASSALRFHFGEVLMSSLARAGVILLLGIPLLSVVVFETLLAFNTLFHHSDVRLPPKLERALSWIIVTPSIHWVHHHAVRRDTDSNYAALLSVWDRLFASRSPTVRTPEMPVGAEGLKDRGFAGLLARPFEER
ncbi:sterol desaturase family protein [Aestuariivirga sp.]|uniref:sterol desaturase family protein n=1 Tax=Aestuariivirga sp. TaxID=2650926 RepID=UPI0025B88F8A|nr:sterol desaturase family protein [Aestuariivirga sp.]MCA3555062.1 sterol desaturase family protein [Aestuariivirga sp.]